MPPPSVLIVLSIAALFINNVNAADSAIAFSYSGPTAPEKWGTLDPSFATCSNGKMQSPIDIITPKVMMNNTLKPLTRDYRAINTTMVAKGVAVGLHYEGNAGVVIVDGKNYTLQGMHWHTPSEHKINGVQFDAELHLVHSGLDKKYVVIGILYKIGHADPLLARINPKLVELNKEKQKCKPHEEAKLPMGMYDLEQLKRVTRSRAYFRYYGSLTTPPCNETVMWHVLARVRQISKEQVELLKGPLDAGCKNNERPVQELNGRVVHFHNAPKHKK